MQARVSVRAVAGDDQWVLPGVHAVSRICYLVAEVGHDWREFLSGLILVMVIEAALMRYFAFLHILCIQYVRFAK